MLPAAAAAAAVASGSADAFFCCVGGCDGDGDGGVAALHASTSTALEWQDGSDPKEDGGDGWD